MNKKWISILIALGLTVPTFAQDDEEYYDEEGYYEEDSSAPRRTSKRNSQRETEEASGPSRIGLKFGFSSVSFSGNSGTFTPNVGLVYDMGSGLVLGLDLGLNRSAVTPDEGDAPDPEMDIVATPNIKYALGKGLLEYGLGLDVSIISQTAGIGFGAFPNFYAGTELVPNVALGLSAGFNVEQTKYDYGEPDTGSNLNMGFRTNLALVFYFM